MPQYTTIEEIASARDAIEARLSGYRRPVAHALGVATVSPSGNVLDTSYPVVNHESGTFTAAVLASVLGHASGTATYRVDRRALDDALARLAPAEGCTAVAHPNLQAWRGLRALLDRPAPRGGERVLFAAFLGALDDAPIDVPDVYLRLHLLSHRHVRPRTINLDGVFGLLPNVVWTNHGPFEPEGFDLRRLELRTEGGEVQVHGLDKFPRMTDYVIPRGVRIADANRVRLGAHLAEGTTVMHEGFCNFNAGTLGPSMVEGRISAGVVVGAHSDLGGSASIMGTLSGGGKEVISVGERCLIGANAGIGISLGDDCIVEAGCYVTAGSMVRLPDGAAVKGRELSGRDGVLFRRNSLTGAIEALPRAGATWSGLNTALHDN